MSLSDTPVTTRKINGMEMRANAREPSSQNHDAQNDAASSQCHGTFQCQPDDQFEGSRNGNEDKWLCKHYKRRCLVKFECCNKYWPCHRCHNNESTCGHTKLKSRDTTMVKCVECGKEQQVTNKMLKLFTHICDIFSTVRMWNSRNYLHDNN